MLGIERERQRRCSVFLSQVRKVRRPTRGQGNAPVRVINPHSQVQWGLRHRPALEQLPFSLAHSRNFAISIISWSLRLDLGQFMSLMSNLENLFAHSLIITQLQKHG